MASAGPMPARWTVSLSSNDIGAIPECPTLFVVRALRRVEANEVSERKWIAGWEPLRGDDGPAEGLSSMSALPRSNAECDA